MPQGSTLQCAHILVDRKRPEQDSPQVTQPSDLPPSPLVQFHHFQPRLFTAALISRVAV